MANVKFVIKRDGTGEPFDEEKIVTAIEKAMASVGPVNQSDTMQARAIAF